MEEIDGGEDSKSYASSNNPGVKINRGSRANVDMRCVLQKLDGEAEEKTKQKVRNRKQELEHILNTTHSIKMFA